MPLLGVLGFAVAFLAARPGAKPWAPLFGMEEAPAADPLACFEEDCFLPAEGTGVRKAPEVVFSSADVCTDAGYLCAEAEVGESQRLLRWPDTQEELVVYVPAPDFEPTPRARTLQSAAVRGIQAWQGRPFTLRIYDRATDTQADIVVRWSRQLGGSSLGHTRSEWRDDGAVRTLRIVDFALATRSPYNERYELSPHEVELVAAHEMGHALGLPHSESSRDVMYPTNTARSLSARDYRTLEALYRLPNGARIEP